MFEAAIAMSRKWDAADAGQEIGEQIISKLKNKPKFVLLFSTIHYEKHGGFQKFLDAVNRELPEGTPVVGGTFSGFANNIGCFTRGATAIAVYADEMDVKSGFGKNIKRSPQKAAEDCLRMIGGSKSTFRNKYLFEFISSGTVPKYTGLGIKRVLKLPRILNSLINPILSLSTITLQFGAGREEEALEYFSKNLPEHMIFGGSTSDDNRWERSYQFFNGTPLQNSVVALSIETNIEVASSSKTGFQPTGIKLNPTKIGNFDCSIIEIDKEPALDRFSSKIGWPIDLFDERLHRRTLYYPLGTKDENGEYLRLIALVVGSNLVFSNRIKSTELEIYTASGKNLISAIDSAISDSRNATANPLFSLIISCTTRLEALGSYIYSEQEKLKRFLKETPFVVIYASGEDSVEPSGKWVRRNESFNLLSFFNEA